MTSERYPGWDIAETTVPGGKREWVMVRDGIEYWVRVVEWKRNTFTASVYLDGRLDRRGLDVATAVDMAEF